MLRRIILCVIIVSIAIISALSYKVFSISQAIELIEKGPIQQTSFMQHYCKTECAINWMSLNQIPNLFKIMVIKREDPTFWKHNGFDTYAIKRAIYFNWHEKAFVKGASTISSQVSKNLFLTSEKTLFRKLHESLITVVLERMLSKARILEIYLNIIELGPDTFGIKNGAKRHFNKEPSQLSLREIVKLVAILPSPRKHSQLSSNPPSQDKVDTIINNFLSFKHKAATQKAIEDTKDCADFLSSTQIQIVDEALDTIYLMHGTAIEQGDGALLTLPEILNDVDVVQKTEIEKIYVESTSESVPEACSVPKVNTEFRLIENTVREGSRNYWVPAPAYESLIKMMNDAESEHIQLNIESAYRASGYQLYLALQMTKRLNYCISETFKLVERPFRSEHGCYEAVAIDFSTTGKRGVAFSQSNAFEWLKNNAEKYNYTLSYDHGNTQLKNFEPWHWQYN
ncbi:transglycosylase domain-containing protein [Aliiglaciecola litoralis]|uniref:Uncharacterized protein n=1 Tax=Aliiglaciecola litoralis TaxID=582857 RepID=A0ABN1LSG4_9ALTE